MIINKVKLKNWKNFQNVEAELTDRSFLIGPNASGKSNFLDAFRFLRDIAKQGGGLQKAVSDRGGIPKIRCLAARSQPEVEIEVHVSRGENLPAQWIYSIGIIQEVRGYRNAKITHERVWKNEVNILDRPNKDDNEDELRKTQTHLEQVNQNKEFRELVDFFSSINYFHLVPQLIRYPEAFKGKAIEEDPFGHGFLERILKTNEVTRKSRLRKIEKVLLSTVPNLKGLDAKRDKETGQPHIRVVYEHWRPKGAKQTEEQLSDGTLRLIGFLWSVLDGDSLLLLEEPELSLHVEIVRLLPELIFELLKDKKARRQIIISTHSPELLSNASIGGEETLLLTPGPEGTTITKASDINEVKALLEGGMSVGEAAIPKTKPRGLSQLGLFNG